MIPPVRARQLIEDGARRALSNRGSVAPYDPGRPCEIRAEYKRTDVPDRLRYRPGVERVDGRTIVSRADTWWEAWKQFYF
jgi:D-amino peptidase